MKRGVIEVKNHGENEAKSRFEWWRAQCHDVRPKNENGSRMNGDDAVELRFSTISSILDPNVEIVSVAVFSSNRQC